MIAWVSSSLKKVFILNYLFKHLSKSFVTDRPVWFGIPEQSKTPNFFLLPTAFRQIFVLPTSSCNNEGSGLKSSPTYRIFWNCFTLQCFIAAVYRRKCDGVKPALCSVNLVSDGCRLNNMLDFIAIFTHLIDTIKFCAFSVLPMKFSCKDSTASPNFSAYYWCTFNVIRMSNRMLWYTRLSFVV